MHVLGPSLWEPGGVPGGQIHQSVHPPQDDGPSEFLSQSGRFILSLQQLMIVTTQVTLLVKAPVDSPSGEQISAATVWPHLPRFQGLGLPCAVSFLLGPRSCWGWVCAALPCEDGSDGSLCVRAETSGLHPQVCAVLSHPPLFDDKPREGVCHGPEEGTNGDKGACSVKQGDSVGLGLDFLTCKWTKPVFPTSFEPNNLLFRLNYLWHFSGYSA